MTDEFIDLSTVAHRQNRYREYDRMREAWREDLLTNINATLGRLREEISVEREQEKREMHNWKQEGF